MLNIIKNVSTESKHKDLVVGILEFFVDNLLYIQEYIEEFENLHPNEDVWAKYEALGQHIAKENNILGVNGSALEPTIVRNFYKLALKEVEERKEFVVSKLLSGIWVFHPNHLLESVENSN